MVVRENLVKRSVKASLIGALVVGALYALFTMIWHITSQQVDVGVLAYATALSFATCSIPAFLAFVPAFALFAYILEGRDEPAAINADPPRQPHGG